MNRSARTPPRPINLFFVAAGPRSRHSGLPVVLGDESRVLHRGPSPRIASRSFRGTDLALRNESRPPERISHTVATCRYTASPVLQIDQSRAAEGRVPVASLSTCPRYPVLGQVWATRQRGVSPPTSLPATTALTVETADVERQRAPNRVPMMGVRAVSRATPTDRLLPEPSQSWLRIVDSHGQRRENVRGPDLGICAGQGLFWGGALGATRTRAHGSGGRNRSPCLPRSEVVSDPVR